MYDYTISMETITFYMVYISCHMLFSIRVNHVIWPYISASYMDRNLMHNNEE